jgi:hypothetical protein
MQLFGRHRNFILSALIDAVDAATMWPRREHHDGAAEFDE